MTEAVPLSSFLLAVSCIDKSVFGVTQLGSMTLPGKQLTAVPLKVSSTWRLYSIVYSVLLLVLAPLNPYILLLSKVGSSRVSLFFYQARLYLGGASPSATSSTFGRSCCMLNNAFSTLLERACLLYEGISNFVYWQTRPRLTCHLSLNISMQCVSCTQG